MDQPTLIATVFANIPRRLVAKRDDKWAHQLIDSRQIAHSVRSQGESSSTNHFKVKVVVVNYT